MKRILSLFFVSITFLSNAQTEVGVTNGNLSVSLTGAASYTIPIAVPPGLNGVVPQVSLNYNSQGGNGLAGYGWNLSGLSVISRIPSTKYHDGISDPIDFDSYDRFALDGQRLILKSGTYGATGSIYETETFSNVKITCYASYFVVEYPDGSIAHYGNSTDSKSITTWAITYWQNPQNIRINYNYILLNNNLSIDNIKYGNIGQSQSLNQIKFIYKNKNRNEYGYIAGINFINSQIISEIRVESNNEGFKNYLLEHSFSDLGYEKLVKVTEKSGDNLAVLNPTVFEYNDEIQPATDNYLTTQLNKTFQHDKFKAINLDLDGKNGEDYIFLGKEGVDKNKLWIYRKSDDGTIFNSQIDLGINNNILDVFPSNLLIGNSTEGYKIHPDQGFTTVRKYSNSENSMNFVLNSYIFNSTTGNIVLDQSKVISTGGISPGERFLIGDFNGDGISDCILIARSLYVNYNFVDFIDLRKDNTVYDNYHKDCGLLQSSMPVTTNTQFDVLDFNGDGRTDFVVYNIEGMYVYTLDPNTYSLVLLVHNPSINNINVVKYVGDFNGDGKSDILVPHGIDSSLWTYYISNGLGFVSFSDYFESYRPYRRDFNTMYCENMVNVPPTHCTADYYDTEETIFYIKDFNGDGKSDIISQKHHYRNLTRRRNYYYDFGQIVYSNWVDDPNYSNYTVSKTLNFYTNKNCTINSIEYDGEVKNLYATKIGTITLISNSQKNDILNFDFNYLVDNKIYTISSNKNHINDMLLKKITIGNGVSESITYSPLKFQDTIPLGSTIPIYNYPYTFFNYPGFDIKNATSLNLVTKLERQSSTVFNKKLFAYDSAVTNYEGLGFLGFKSTMQTNWFNDDSKIISNVSIADINLRGAIIKNIVVAGLVGPTYNYNPTTFISKNVNTYNTDALQTNKVLKLKKLNENKYDGLNNTSVAINYEYNSNNNLTFIGSSTINGTTAEQLTATNFVYDLPLSNPYMIDRIKSKSNSVKILPSNNITNTEEIYTYSVNLLKQVKKKGNNTNYITEDYKHDVYGNITKKSLSTTDLTVRATNFEYDALTHRFLTKKTDNEGLITQYTYNQSTGLLLSELLPSNSGFPLITNFEYDKWGKKIKVIDYLSKELTYTYENISNGGVKLTTNRSDNSSEITIVDDLGRKIHEGSKLIDDKWSYVSTVYDNNDKPILKSQPYLETLGLGNYPVWNEMKYDIYGRLTEAKTLKSNNSPGKISAYSYNGLTTTESDNFKSKITTKNSLGQIVTVTDNPNGGTINYYYWADGNLRLTNFNGVVTSLEYDGWGRKTKLIDPSAGTYQYQYNNFGETTKEIAPKGETTYTFDDFGKLTQKTIIGLNGDPTDSKTVYTYNPTTKLLTNTRYDDFAGGFYTLYSYGYDNYKRLNFSDESGFNAYYQRATQFDSFGRPEKELYTAINTSDSKRSDKWVRNSYKNGLPWQIFDDATNKVLWETNTTNASGKLLSGYYGNGISVSNAYDTFGFPREIDHSLNTTGIMYLETLFEPIRGNLVDRSNGMFGFVLEEFQYDSLDRLSTYTDKNGAQVTQTYDNLGRIDASPIGTHNYAISGKAFQNSSVSLTPEADAYYNSRSGLDITYNSFKSPIDIKEEGHEKLSFIYNMNNSRSTMYYGGLDDDKLLRPLRKHYSADGSMEIKQNSVTGTTEFITYIGGDAYSAPIILKSDGTTQNYFYLHRDYQGSILAITDKKGKIVEKRRFDVWGNIAEVQDGEGNNLSQLTFIDRGYTGHEHLQGVVLIHMNGRLYDPMVHRFLQPDNNIQDPYNTQNYNRYSYVMNNPTKYTDPSGEIGWLVHLAVAVVSAYVSGVQASGGQLNPFKWDSVTWVNAGMGAAGYAASTASTNYLNAYVDNYGKNDTPKDFGGGNPVEEHEFVVYENLPTIYIAGRSKSSGEFSYSSEKLVGGFRYGLAEKVRDQAYQFGSAYQSRRDGIASRQLDETEDYFSALGNAPLIGEPFDALSGTISLFRGNFKKAGISAFAMFPLLGNTSPVLKYSDEIGTAFKPFSGTTKALGNGIPNSVYSQTGKDGTLVSKYFYNDAGKVNFQIDFQRHGNWPSGHGHSMSIPGSIGSGHQGSHIPFMLVPKKYW